MIKQIKNTIQQIKDTQGILNRRNENNPRLETMLPNCTTSKMKKTS